LALVRLSDQGLIFFSAWFVMVTPLVSPG